MFNKQYFDSCVKIYKLSMDFTLTILQLCCHQKY